MSDTKSNDVKHKPRSSKLRLVSSQQEQSQAVERKESSKKAWQPRGGDDLAPAA